MKFITIETRSIHAITQQPPSFESCIVCVSFLPQGEPRIRTYAIFVEPVDDLVLYAGPDVCWYANGQLPPFTTSCSICGKFSPNLMSISLVRQAVAGELTDLGYWNDETRDTLCFS